MLSSISKYDTAIGPTLYFGRIDHCYILDDFMPVIVLLMDGGLVEANLSVIIRIAIDCLIARFDRCEMVGSRLAKSVAFHVSLDGVMIIDVDDKVNAV